MSYVTNISSGMFNTDSNVLIKYIKIHIKIKSATMSRSKHKKMNKDVVELSSDEIIWIDFTATILFYLFEQV